MLSSNLRKANTRADLLQKDLDDIDDFREVVNNSDSSKVLLLIYRNGNYFYTAIKE